MPPNSPSGRSTAVFPPGHCSRCGERLSVREELAGQKLCAACRAEPASAPSEQITSQARPPAPTPPEPASIPPPQSPCPAPSPEPPLPRPASAPDAPSSSSLPLPDSPKLSPAPPFASPPVRIVVDSVAVHDVPLSESDAPAGLLPPFPPEVASAVRRVLYSRGGKPGGPLLVARPCPRCEQRAVIPEPTLLRSGGGCAIVSVLVLVAIFLAVESLALLTVFVLLASLVGFAWAVSRSRQQRWICLSCGYRGPWGERP